MKREENINSRNQAARVAPKSAAAFDPRAISISTRVNLHLAQAHLPLKVPTRIQPKYLPVMGPRCQDMREERTSDTEFPSIVVTNITQTSARLNIYKTTGVTS